LKAFQQNQVLTKEEILQVTQCSTMTAWRLLQRHGYYTSYNCNARYYTLADIPKFDQHGLWNSGKIRFSRWGSLTETVIALVQNSQAGMNAEQLQDLLLVKDLRPALGKLYRQGRLGREKIGGRFVYFPREDASDRRERRRQMESPPVLPPLEQIIVRRPAQEVASFSEPGNQSGIIGFRWVGSRERFGRDATALRN
jgi:hypothetical protein